MNASRMKRNQLIIVFLIVILVITGLLYHYRYLLWYQKFDITGLTPPALLNIETNHLDFKTSGAQNLLLTPHIVSPNGAIIKYPGTRLILYFYEPSAQWASFSFKNLSDHQITFFIKLNENLIESIRIEPDQNKLKIFLPLQFQIKGRNTLDLIMSEETGKIELSELFLNPTLLLPQIIASYDSKEPGTFWFQGRGEIVYYANLPSDAYLDYALSFKINPSFELAQDLNIKVTVESDDAARTYEHTIKMNTKNNLQWKRYITHLAPFSNKKARLRFTLLFKNKKLLGNASFGLKAALRGNSDHPAAAAKIDANNSRYNVIIIVLDAASASHFSSYGYPQKTTPEIDAFAKRSAVFTNAYTTAVYTRGSTSSIYTSLYPEVHRISFSKFILPEDAKTLAEIFSENGYKTALFSGNGNVSDQTGLNQGFADYFALFGHPDEEQMSSKIMQWLDKIRNRPFFVYAHYRYPHPPFDAPVALRIQFNKTTLPTLPINDTLTDKIYSGNILPTPEQKNYVISQYDANIFYADSMLHELFAYINAHEIINNTIIILMADHGEAMGEHGAYGHNVDLHIETSRIPFIFYYPRFNQQRMINLVIDNVDLMPTLIELLSLKGVPTLMQGKSFASCIINNLCSDPGSEAYIATVNRQIFSVADKQHQMIFDQEHRSWELYDLLNDPQEQHNIHGNLLITSAYYRDRILQFLHKNAQIRYRYQQFLNSNDSEPTGEVLENLKALGYVK